jgi:biopolymer transport protein ExbB/TolQ
MHGRLRSSMAMRYAVRRLLAFAAGVAIAAVFAAQAAAIVDARGQHARLMADSEREKRAIADLVRSEHHAKAERDRVQERLESALAELAAITTRLDDERQRTAAAINRELLKALERERARTLSLERELGCRLPRDDRFR